MLKITVPSTSKKHDYEFQYMGPNLIKMGPVLRRKSGKISKLELFRDWYWIAYGITLLFCIYATFFMA